MSGGSSERVELLSRDRRSPRTIVPLALLLAAELGCRQPSSQAEDPTALPATYAKHIAPVIVERCAPCHRPGGPGPFSLLDYEDVRQRARLIVEATRSRLMPPWLPEPGYGAFAGERRLTNDQIETFARWVDHGMPEGDRADLPARPAFPDGWQLGEPDLVVKMPRAFTLQPDGSDVWRNFVIPIPLSGPKLVKTIELRPGSARVVHHALMAIDETRASRRLDERDVEPGFEGMVMGEAHMPQGSLLGWTPGMAPFPGVEGAAWRLEPRTDLVLQLHMMPSGKAEVIDPLIGFYFARTADIGPPLHVFQLDADDSIDIPAGHAEFAVTDTIVLPVDVEVLAVYPHAHFLGKSLLATVHLPDGRTQPLIRIDRWDFKWQDVYRLVTPLALPKGTQVTMRWIYDNSAANERQRNNPPSRVRAGDRSSDEMAHLQLQVRLRSPQDRALLQEATFRHFVQRDSRNVQMRYGLAGALKDQGRFAEAAREYQATLAIDPAHVRSHINLGAVLMEQGRAAEAVGHFKTAVELDPSSAGAHYNLGFVSGVAGNQDEAIRQYGEAVRLEPGFAEAHNNLGQMLQARGRLGEAIDHFRAAARVMPDSAEVLNNLGAALLAQGNLEEAVAHLRRALELAPRHPDVRDNLNRALKAAGNKDR